MLILKERLLAEADEASRLEADQVNIKMLAGEKDTVGVEVRAETAGQATEDASALAASPLAASALAASPLSTSALATSASATSASAFSASTNSSWAASGSASTEM